MVGRIEQDFPGLHGTGYRVTSPEADTYNCIAHAAGDSSDWWWPDEPDDPDSAFWPAGIPREETVEAFRAAFATLGYVVCDDDQLETGYEKVAIFALAGMPKHAARQLPSGHWTSKLGPKEDIEHTLQALTGHVYGSVVLVLKRPLPTAGETVQCAGGQPP